MVSRNSGASTTSLVLGTMIMVSADAQKYFTLRERRSLISFALMIWHWFPVLVLALVWGGFFAPNMAAKEQSLARYPEWADYKRRS